MAGIERTVLVSAATASADAAADCRRPSRTLSAGPSYQPAARSHLARVVITAPDEQGTTRA